MTDAINPKHYQRENAMECIDEMIMLYGEEAVMHFCLCNAHKYRYRAIDKNGMEDAKKSDWYMAKYKELKDKHEKDFEEKINNVVSVFGKGGVCEC